MKQKIIKFFKEVIGCHLGKYHYTVDMTMEEKIDYIGKGMCEIRTKNYVKEYMYKILYVIFIYFIFDLTFSYYPSFAFMIMYNIVLVLFIKAFFGIYKAF